MQHLWVAWQEIAETVGRAEHILLLSDFDGTLSPIVADPDSAALPAETRQRLQDLACRPRITAVVISGRALSDVKARVGIPGMTYAGNHGLEIEGSHIRFVHPLAEQAAPVIHGIYGELSQALAHIEGVLVEDKGLTLSVHYRLVAKGRMGELKRMFDEVVNRVSPPGQITATHGKKVYEVRPAVDWDKGKAVDLLMDLCGREGLLPIFMGDDLTDEDGFTTVNRRDGLSIFVGQSTAKSSAGYAVQNPSEVTEFLGRLLSIPV